MSGSNPSSRTAARALPEALARTLRHEVGDFLQKVYASVAILQARFPTEWEMEREILDRLRKRAEICKELLDAIQDFLCPIIIDRDGLDLVRLATLLTAEARQRFPKLDITCSGPAAAPVIADPERVAQVGRALLANAAEAAQQRVTFITETDPAGDAIRWIITDDGPGVSAEDAGRLFTPFFTTRSGHAGLGLVLARKIVDLHGGQISAANPPQGGFDVTVTWPVQAEKTDRTQGA
jgi:signal transduction histidine kinase